jgi:hypothetical protein
MRNDGNCGKDGHYGINGIYGKNGIFFILHSSLFILHSSFYILHSTFFTLHSSFKKNGMVFSGCTEKLLQGMRKGFTFASQFRKRGL